MVKSTTTETVPSSTASIDRNMEMFNSHFNNLKLRLVIVWRARVFVVVWRGTTQRNDRQCPESAAPHSRPLVDLAPAMPQSAACDFACARWPASDSQSHPPSSSRDRHTIAAGRVRLVEQPTGCCIQRSHPRTTLDRSQCRGMSSEIAKQEPQKLPSHFSMLWQLETPCTLHLYLYHLWHARSFHAE